MTGEAEGLRLKVFERRAYLPASDLVLLAGGQRHEVG